MSVDHEARLEREQIANRKKHWVRAVTACSSRCLFCLDADTPRNLIFPVEQIEAELRRGIEELGADKVIISGGEATLHPQFPELIAYAKSIGYERVQTVTNGWHFADKDFYLRCLRAGLGEITFSLHGHTPRLHDSLCQHEGSFQRLMKGLIRAVRHRALIVNVDVVINRQNVAHIDKIVELAASVGVREFDLLHVIPQASAYDNRELLFYDVREHLPRLQKVFKLNRHPGFVIWTNRFPVSFLEGMEDLIQDPHKLLDEVNGRRFQLRRYFDQGTPLDCRQPERCVHCFIEPFCTSADRDVARLKEQAWDVWDLGSSLEASQDFDPLPFGARLLGVEIDALSDLADLRRPEGQGFFVRAAAWDLDLWSLPRGGGVLLATEPGQLDHWIAGSAPDEWALQIQLNARTAPWMIAHKDALSERLVRFTVHQPRWERLSEAGSSDVRDPGRFFATLGLRLRVSGLPACAAPGTDLMDGLRVLPRSAFDADTGQLAIAPLARRHVREHYLAKSIRCEDCAVTSRCEGLHINMVRDQGLRLCRPLRDGAWAEDAVAQLLARWPKPQPRLASGKPSEGSAPLLPGFVVIPPAAEDPLAALSRDKEQARHRRRLQILDPKGRG